MFSCFNKSENKTVNARGLFIGAMSHVKLIVETRLDILFLNEDVPVKEAKITAEGDFSQPSSKHHSFAEVFLVLLIIKLIWGERQDFEIKKPAKG